MRTAAAVLAVVMMANPHAVTGAPQGSSTPVPRLQFERTAVVHGHVESWSPSGAKLLLRDDRGLSVFDAMTPNVPPRRVLPIHFASETVRWSPDGTWLACALRSPTDPVDGETLHLVVSGDAILGTELYVGDAGGAWKLPLVGPHWDTSPVFSRTGRFVAIGRSDSSLVEVGVLTIVPQ